MQPGKCPLTVVKWDSLRSVGLAKANLNHASAAEPALKLAGPTRSTRQDRASETCFAYRLQLLQTPPLARAPWPAGVESLLPVLWRRLTARWSFRHLEKHGERANKTLFDAM